MLLKVKMVRSYFVNGSSLNREGRKSDTLNFGLIVFSLRVPLFLTTNKCLCSIPLLLPLPLAFTLASEVALNSFEPLAGLLAQRKFGERNLNEVQEQRIELRAAKVYALTALRVAFPLSLTNTQTSGSQPRLTRVVNINANENWNENVFIHKQLSSLNYRACKGTGNVSLRFHEKHTIQTLD